MDGFMDAWIDAVELKNAQRETFAQTSMAKWFEGALRTSELLGFELFRV